MNKPLELVITLFLIGVLCAGLMAFVHIPVDTHMSHHQFKVIETRHDYGTGKRVSFVQGECGHYMVIEDVNIGEFGETFGLDCIACQKRVGVEGKLPPPTLGYKGDRIPTKK
jgi:hypothetical protein